MSGLDGGAPAPTAGTGGEDVSVRSQPAVARTHQQASDALDARVMAKVAAAREGEGGHQNAAGAAPSLNRAPDGKFLPKGLENIHGAQAQPKAQAKPSEAVATTQAPSAVSPDKAAPAATTTAETSPAAAKPDPEIEKIKGEHARFKADAEALRARDGQWTELAEKAMARLETAKGEIASLRSLLEQHGVSLDPRDSEILRYREQDRVRALADERAQMAAQQQAAEREEQQRAQQRQQLTNSTRTAMAKYPQVAAGTPEWVEACRLIYRGADPEMAFAHLATKVAGKTQAHAAPIPRTLPASRGGSGGPVLKDPRDVADKWKSTLPMNAR